MKQFVSARSKLEGFPSSRLPQFAKEEIEYIRGTSDYLGFNHYTSKLVANARAQPDGRKVSFESDLGVREFVDPSWPPTAADWFKVRFF